MQLVAFEHAGPSRSRTPARGSSWTASMGAAALGFETLEAVRPGARRMGAVIPSGPHEGAIIDLNRALAVKLADEDAGAPECEADSQLPSEPRAFLGRWAGAVEVARSTLAFVAHGLERYDTPDLASAGVVLDRRQVRLACPVARPGNLLAAGAARRPDGRPTLRLRASSCVAGPEDELVLRSRAPHTARGELAVVIGRHARDVRPDDALAHVAGYCAAISVRAGEETDPLAWSGDGFTSLGPALVTADAVPEPHDLGLHTRLSGSELQSARTKALALPVSEAVARASAAMTLAPGDVLLVGVPGPDAESRPLRDGDLFEVEIERVGRIARYVRNAPEDAPSDQTGT